MHRSDSTSHIKETNKQSGNPESKIPESVTPKSNPQGPSKFATQEINSRVEKKSLHPRNRHLGRYNFDELIQIEPTLASFLMTNPRGEPSIDFSASQALIALNRALLKSYYGLTYWEIPEGHLCPPIPGRADYIHSVADLLATSHEGVIPKGETIRALDIGVGSSCIYPLIGHCEYGWAFIGSDIDTLALENAHKIIELNRLGAAIELRQQLTPLHIFTGCLREGERFDVCLCNPPFHRSLQEARVGTERKWKNLIADSKARQSDHLNFGGRVNELCYPGGEIAFVKRMIEESATYPTQIFWYSSLISKESNLPILYKALKDASVASFQTLNMAQGQKRSRALAWTFLSPGQQEAWRKERLPHTHRR